MNQNQTQSTTEPEFLYTAIRMIDGKLQFVELPWALLDDSERRQIQSNIFLLYGAEF